MGMKRYRTSIVICSLQYSVSWTKKFANIWITIFILYRVTAEVLWCGRVRMAGIILHIKHNKRDDKSMVADPHHTFDADADPDPSFNFISDPEVRTSTVRPRPSMTKFRAYNTPRLLMRIRIWIPLLTLMRIRRDQSDANIRTLVYRPSTTLRWAYIPPLLASTALRD